MKPLITFGMLSGALAILLMPPRFVAHAASDNVTISVDMHLTGQTSAEGTFTASGAINGSGTATETFQMAADGKSVEGEKTLVMANGTVSIHFSGPISPVAGSSDLQVTGTWVVVSGTGAYSGISGGGQINTILDPNAGTLHADYTGSVTLAGASPGMPRTGVASSPALMLLLALAGALLAGGAALSVRSAPLKRRSNI